MTRPAILDEVAERGWVVFREGRPYSPPNPNLVVERITLDAAGYADRMHLIYAHGGAWVHHSWACDTVPHPAYLAKPLHPDGSPLLVEGQHRGAYVLGDHHGRPALVPTRALPVRRVRRRDRTVGDLGPVVLADGIRIHDGDWVAGCIGMPRPHLVELLAALAPTWATYGPVSLSLIDRTEVT